MTGELTVPLRVKPGSSRTRVGGCYAGPYGDALVVAVGERAVDGAATEAARKAVASALGVRPRQVRLVAGLASRDKLLAISEPSPDALSRLAALLGEAPR